MIILSVEKNAELLFWLNSFSSLLLCGYLHLLIFFSPGKISVFYFFFFFFFDKIIKRFKCFHNVFANGQAWRNPYGNISSRNLPGRTISVGKNRSWPFVLPNNSLKTLTVLIKTRFGPKRCILIWLLKLTLIERSVIVASTQTCKLIINYMQ